MTFPEYEQARQYEKDYNLIPVSREIYADVITPITLLRRLSQVDDRFYLLESVEGGKRWGRYSFLGFSPLLQLTCRRRQVTVRSGAIETTAPGEGLAALREYLNRYRAPQIEGLPSFAGGFVGYFSYELIGHAEPNLKLQESEFPEYDLMMFDKVIAYDHLKQKIVVIANYAAKDGEKGYRAAELELGKMLQLILEEGPLPREEAPEAPEFVCNVSREQYCAMVEKTKHYIREGDIFQGVISRKFTAEYRGSLLNAYRVLRTTNPSPYMYFIQNGDLQIAGTSPETMVKLSSGRLTTFPVAGTRPRGATKEEDEALERELMADEKELAEHNMLVDLARNDIGKIAEYGSVEVEEYMQLHRFSKVMHIASVVTGQLRSDKDGCDTVSALLPAGTLSGAPKFRACEIIGELEPEARGVYGGAIGYLDFSGNLDVCIAIRTAVKYGGRVSVQAGAGIVADSVPENEYQECANKAGAVIEAIRRASEVNGL
ncbi:MAG: anthranilate synthase component I [Lachnospiraceae bacterium]|nr:anthranilate synthase component I [Lachnospiraceae bacterium]